MPYLSSVLSVRERFDLARPVSSCSSLRDLGLLSGIVCNKS